MAVGGQDLVCVKQRYTSPISPADLRRNLQDVGDILFSDGNSSSLLQRTARDGKHKVSIFVPKVDLWLCYVKF